MIISKGGCDSKSSLSRQKKMVDSLLLIAIQVYHIGSNNNKERYNESAPKGAHHDDHSSYGRERNEITETNRANSDNYNPHRLKELVEINQSQLSIIDNLENPKLIGEYESRDDQ
jgi:hypothetical protein